MPTWEEQNQLKRNLDTSGTSLTCRETQIKGEKEKEKPTFPVCLGMNSPTKTELAKVDDFPPPALSGSGEIDAGWVQLCGAQSGRLWRTSTQGDQEVPGGPKVPGELQTDRIVG